MTGIANPGKTVSIIMRGSNKLMLEEADRYNVFSSLSGLLGVFCTYTLVIAILGYEANTEVTDTSTSIV
jgi:hypothetical protein